MIGLYTAFVGVKLPGGDMLLRFFARSNRLKRALFAAQYRDCVIARTTYSPKH